MEFVAHLLCFCYALTVLSLGLVAPHSSASPAGSPYGMLTVLPLTVGLLLTSAFSAVSFS